jgi:hypothetical protein
VHPDEETAVITLDDIRRMATAFPDVEEFTHFRLRVTYEEVWRPGATKSFVGVRVDLAKVSEGRVQELVEHAWRNKAPKRMVAAYDAQ